MKHIENGDRDGANTYSDKICMCHILADSNGRVITCPLGDNRNWVRSEVLLTSKRQMLL